jgi:hypothetical protein
MGHPQMMSAKTTLAVRPLIIEQPSLAVEQYIFRKSLSDIQMKMNLTMLMVVWLDVRWNLMATNSTWSVFMHHAVARVNLDSQQTWKS